MELMTLKQFADSKSISYEAVRKQVTRFHKELQGHIITKNRTQYLDEWAVSFLSERRRESPIVLLTENQSDKISSLTEQVETLKAQLLKAQDDLIASKNRIISMQDDARQLAEVQANYNLLLESHSSQEKKLRDMESDLMQADLQHEADQARMEELRQEQEDLRKERDDLRNEANSYQKSLFGFYRKVR